MIDQNFDHIRIACHQINKLCINHVFKKVISGL